MKCGNFRRAQTVEEALDVGKADGARRAVGTNEELRAVRGDVAIRNPLHRTRTRRRGEGKRQHRQQDREKTHGEPPERNSACVRLFLWRQAFVTSGEYARALSAFTCGVYPVSRPACPRVPPSARWRHQAPSAGWRV